MQFANLVRNAEEAIFDESDNEEFLDSRNQQPGFYPIEDRENVVYDDFVGYEKLIAKFKKSLSIFDGFEKSFFNAIIYGLLFKVSGEEKPIQAPEFCSEKDSLGMDSSLFNFFEKRLVANELLSKISFF